MDLPVFGSFFVLSASLSYSRRSLPPLSDDTGATMMFAIADIYPSKVFRSSVVKWKQPNDQTLTVVVGPGKTAYWYQPRKIIQHSKCLRAELLASLMKSSRRQRGRMCWTVSPPQVSPSDWEAMLMYKDPTRGRHQRKLNLCDAARLRKSLFTAAFKKVSSYAITSCWQSDNH